jgi:uncharacterized alkaline shock family protein YloU
MSKFARTFSQYGSADRSERPSPRPVNGAQDKDASVAVVDGADQQPPDATRELPQASVVDADAGEPTDEAGKGGAPAAAEGDDVTSPGGSGSGEPQSGVGQAQDSADGSQESTEEPVDSVGESTDSDDEGENAASEEAPGEPPAGEAATAGVEATDSAPGTDPAPGTGSAARAGSSAGAGSVDADATVAADSGVAERAVGTAPVIATASLVQAVSLADAVPIALVADDAPADAVAATGHTSPAEQPAPPVVRKGETTVADEVVEKVAGIAARKVEGVHDLGGDASRLVNAVRERMGFGEGSDGRGVSVKLTGRAAQIAVTLVVAYGHSVYDVADKVRQDVGDAVENMLGIQVTEVNIVVDDVHVPAE